MDARTQRGQRGAAQCRVCGAHAAAGGMWQNEEARCVVVLREVFAWLGGAELARAGATCRVWRCVAADPLLWRRLVLRAAAHAAPTPPTALDVLLATTDNYEWREEYVRAHAPWRLSACVPAGVGGAAGAALLHGALAPKEPWLALAADDASVSVWTHAGGAWRERCRHELREERGWASAARVQWAVDSRRLLVAGPRALAGLAAAWELLVLQYDDECHGRVVSRTRCGAGAAGCWMNSAGDAFLSLETSVLAPGVACTTVWLNAATQETQSEYAGVTTRLLRVYNEDSANILHAVVLELPWSTLDTPPSAGDAASYYRATRGRPATDTDDAPTHINESEWSRLHVLVLCWDGGRNGRGGAVSVWSLGAPQPPPLEAHAAGSLRARYLAHRERMRAPPPDPPPPDEAAVRALCTKPEAACELQAPPLGIAPHPGEQSLWVSTADGVMVCLSVPALVPLRSLAPSVCHPPAPLLLTLPAPAIYYAQPSASHHHVAAPAAALCGGWCACVWSTLCSARQLLQARYQAPPVAALLPSGRSLFLIVLAGDAFHVWHSRATPQSLPGWP